MRCRKKAKKSEKWQRGRKSADRATYKGGRSFWLRDVWRPKERREKKTSRSRKDRPLDEGRVVGLRDVVVVVVIVRLVGGRKNKAREEVKYGELTN